MLSAYFDESGTHDDSPVCVVAGLLAPPLQWERLTADWQRILDEVGIPEFHMSECSPGGGIFKDWPKEAREKLIRRLVHLVVRRATCHVWTAIVMRTYREIFTNDPEELGAYFIGAVTCATLIRHHVIEINPSLSVPYMFEHGGKGSKAVFDAFHQLLDEGRADAYCMGALRAGERRKLLPLQAADLYAYEIHKFFADQVNETGRHMRGSLRALLRIKSPGGYLFTREELETWAQMIEVIKAGDSKGTYFDDSGLSIKSCELTPHVYPRLRKSSLR